MYILNVGSTGLISGVVGPPINGLINGLITGVKKPLLIGVMRLFVLWKFSSLPYLRGGFM